MIEHTILYRSKGVTTCGVCGTLLSDDKVIITPPLTPCGHSWGDVVWTPDTQVVKGKDSRESE